MAKNRTKRFPKKVAGPVRADTRRKSVVEVVIGARESLYELSIATGLQVVEALLEEDRVDLCGPKGVHDRDRKMYRGGHDSGVLVLGGRKVRVRKPRVRERNGPEVPLGTYEALSDEDPLQSRAYEQMVVGVSTRKYDRSLEPLPEGTKSYGTSKSEVSRNFVARTEAQLTAFLGRSLEQWDLPVLMLDGIHFGDHVLLVALGIDRTGQKHVLGVREGTTESEAVCRGLLSDLVDRGLIVERARLFVVDGSKGLRKAIHRVFGAWALIARCRRHKLENVAAHLPKSKGTWVRTSLNKACQAAGSSESLTWTASMPGYQLNLVTMPSACTLGLVASAMNFLARAWLAAFSGMT